MRQPPASVGENPFRRDDGDARLIAEVLSEFRRLRVKASVRRADYDAGDIFS